MNKTIFRPLLIFGLTCLVLLLCFFFPQKASAYYDDATGFMYYIYNEEVVIDNCPSGKTGSLIIPETLGGYPVKHIGKYAFADCTGLTSVTIPNSVTSIGDRAFRNCTGLTSVTIPNSVTSIGDYAFYGCSGLTCTIFLKQTSVIGDYAFFDCTGLTRCYYAISAGSVSITDCSDGKSGSLIIPETLGGYPVKYIGYKAFSDCTELTHVTIPNSVTSIGGYAFSDCTGLTSVTIPNSVTSIGKAFSDCTGLTSVTIPNSVTSIEGSAFSGCTGLTSVTIPNSVTSIGYSAFSGCTGLTSVTIPNSVTSIGGSAFSGCTGLTSVYITDVAAWCKISFSDDAANPLRYADKFYVNRTHVTDLVIPSSVTSICDYAFYGYTGLTRVVLSEGVKSIGRKSFGSCNNLTIVKLPDSLLTIGEDAFSACTSLKTLDIPQNVSRIYADSFYGCSSLQSVYFYTKSSPTVEYDSSSGYYSDFAGTSDTLIFYFPFKCYSSTWYGVIVRQFCGVGHSYSSWQTVSSATCTAAGSQEQTCSVCGHKNTSVIDAKGHSYGSWTTVTAATERAEGLSRRTCSTCKGTDDKIIPKLPSSGNASGNASGNGGNPSQGGVGGDYIPPINNTEDGTDIVTDVLTDPVRNSDSNSVSTDLANPGSASTVAPVEDSGFPLWIIFVAIGGALAVAVAVILGWYFLIVKKMKNGVK